MERPDRKKRCALFFAMAAAAIILDQLTKAWVRAALPKAGDTAPFIPGVLRLLHVENTGAAFSMGEGKGFFFVAIAVAIFAIALAAVIKEEMPVPFALALGAVAGGGIGNMIDRLAQGSVTDFFATQFMDFPVFNVADIFVTLGVIAVLVCLMREGGERG
ncbi:MAG: signal peptidase II [Atopobiaceae bacterium]